MGLVKGQDEKLAKKKKYSSQVLNIINLFFYFWTELKYTGLYVYTVYTTKLTSGNDFVKQ